MFFRCSQPSPSQLLIDLHQLYHSLHQIAPYNAALPLLHRSLHYAAPSTPSLLHRAAPFTPSLSILRRSFYSVAFYIAPPSLLRRSLHSVAHSIPSLPTPCCFLCSVAFYTVPLSLLRRLDNFFPNQMIDLGGDITLVSACAQTSVNTT